MSTILSLTLLCISVHSVGAGFGCNMYFSQNSNPTLRGRTFTFNVTRMQSWLYFDAWIDHWSSQYTYCYNVKMKISKYDAESNVYTQIGGATEERARYITLLQTDVTPGTYKFSYTVDEDWDQWFYNGVFMGCHEDHAVSPTYNYSSFLADWFHDIRAFDLTKYDYYQKYEHYPDEYDRYANILNGDISCGITIQDDLASSNKHRYGFVVNKELEWAVFDTCDDSKFNANLGVFLFDGRLKLSASGYSPPESGDFCTRQNVTHLKAAKYWLKISKQDGDGSSYTVQMRCSNDSAVTEATSYTVYVAPTAPMLSSGEIAATVISAVVLCCACKSGCWYWYYWRSKQRKTNKDSPRESTHKDHAIELEVAKPNENDHDIGIQTIGLDNVTAAGNEQLNVSHLEVEQEEGRMVHPIVHNDDVIAVQVRTIIHPRLEPQDMGDNISTAMEGQTVEFEQHEGMQNTK